MSKKQKVTAIDLVRAAAETKSSKTWSDSLSEDDSCYLQNVVAVMRDTPKAALYVVAKAVKLELGLSVGINTIARTLKEMLGQ